MKPFCGVIFTGAAWALIAATASPAEPRAPCKLELVRLEPLDSTQKGWKDTFAYHCIDSQSFFRRVDEKGFTLFAKNGVYKSVAPDEITVVEAARYAKKEPDKLVAKHPLRGAVKLGSREYAFLLDDTDGKAKRYNRLYFDLNGNGDLSDDKPLDILPNQKRGWSPAEGTFDKSNFPRVDLTIEVDGRKTDYSFFVTRDYFQTKEQESVRLYFSAAAYRRGEIMLHGKKHTIALVDWNSNGRFDDVFSLRKVVPPSTGAIVANRGDMLLIDPEVLADDDNIGWNLPSGVHRQFLGKLASFEGDFYDVKVSPAGDEATLTPSALPRGQVASPHAPCRVQLISEMGYLDLNLQKSKPTTIPAGQWQLLSYGITIDNWKEPEKKDVQGAESKPSAPLAPIRGPANRSHVSAYGTTDNSPVVVEAEQTTMLKFGPPYRPFVDVHRWGKETCLLLVLHGADGEVVDGLTVNGRPPAKPTFAITAPKGNTVAAGAFEYG